jgi:integrase
VKGHVRQRGKNSWAIIFDVGKDPVTGKRRQKWHTFRGTKREAQRELNSLLHGIQSGEYVEPNGVLTSEYLEQWLCNYAKPNVSGKSLERYAEIARCHLIPALGAYRLIDLRPLHIQSYYSRALESGRRDGRGGLSARTVLHHHRILREALQQAVKWQLMTRNPADAVEPPQPRHKEMRTLNEPQIASLLDVIRGNELLHMAVLLAATTGMRRGEILAARWRDIDLESGILSVRQSLEETKAGLVFKEPKSKKACRTIALPELAIEGLRRHRAEQARVRLMMGPAWQDNDLVCAQHEVRPLHPRSLTHAFVNLLRRRTDLPRVRFHDLRHSHATLLLRKNVHPKIVSERLGHSTVGITLDVYSHVLPGMQEEAARKIDAALRSAIGAIA